MTSDLPLAYEARILRLRLEFGLVELEEIERWADQTLLMQREPDEQVIELALARNIGRSATFSALLSLGGEVLVPQDVLAALADVKAEHLSGQRLTSLVDSIGAWAIRLKVYEGPAATILWHGYGLSDDLALAKSGVLSHKEVAQRVVDFFDDARRFAVRKG